MKLASRLTFINIILAHFYTILFFPPNLHWLIWRYCTGIWCPRHTFLFLKQTGETVKHKIPKWGPKHIGLLITTIKYLHFYSVYNMINKRLEFQDWFPVNFLSVFSVSNLGDNICMKPLYCLAYVHSTSIIEYNNNSIQI